MNRFNFLFDIFKKRNKKLYFVGGCVRDNLIGREPKDFDFTTNALPEETKEILKFNGLNPWSLGEKFGTIAVKFSNNDIEITTHRKDMTSGRHPEVSFTDDLNLDLKRRDFTINSIAMNRDGKLFDPFNGVEDIKKKIIQTTGLAFERFNEDPLRILRAVRFSSQFGFTIEDKTKKEMKTFSNKLNNISHERWFAEVSKLLMGNNVYNSLDILKETKILFILFPEMKNIFISTGELHSKDLWHHIKTVVSQSKKDVIIRWAALLHDIAKPLTRTEDNGQVHFFNHEVIGSKMANLIAHRFKMSNDMRKSVVGLIRLHQRIGFVKDISDKMIRRLIFDCEKNNCDIFDLINLFESDTSSSLESIKKMIAERGLNIRKRINEMEEENLKPKLPSGIGEEIMKKFNLKPGPEVGKIKNQLNEMLLDGEINTSMNIDSMLEVLDV